MKNLGQMMKQAQELQAKMTEMQERLAELEITGEAGGGMVRVRLSGKGEMRGLEIDPAISVDGDREMLEDLIVAAHNDAKSKLEEMVKEKMSEVTGGLQLPPGMSLPF